ncbi:Toll-like receptor Tollo [Gryllus bimaculatus]|nr:Toll-like receptor Tollo [Gryllus bimaculatus]
MEQGPARPLARIMSDGRHQRTRAPRVARPAPALIRSACWVAAGGRAGGCVGARISGVREAARAIHTRVRWRCVRRRRGSSRRQQRRGRREARRGHRAEVGRLKPRAGDVRPVASRPPAGGGRGGGGGEAGGGSMRAAVAAAMSTFLYTLLGLAAGSSLHCAERRDISPCSCRAQEPGQPLKVACERVAGLSAVLAALAGRFPPETEVALRVAYSELHDLPAHTFQQLGLSIHTLMLNHDNLSALPEEAFSGLGRTEYLSLADNVLTLVPRAALRHMPRLRTLDLGRGAVAALHHGDLQELEALEELQLGHNRLRELNGSLLPLRALRCLNLTHNRFERFSLREILGLRRLFVIDLSANNISALAGHVAQNVVDAETRVVELRLEHNRLRALDGALMGLHGLQRLNLSHNLLEQIMPDDLIGLEGLRVLDISFNRLKTLEETSKTFLPSLEGLFASNNLLTSLQQDFHGLPTLCWADLANNQIETIGRELAAKTRCRIHGVLGTLRIYLYENPVRCDTNLIETVVAMEANFTKLYGLAPCVAENLTTSVAA